MLRFLRSINSSSIYHGCTKNSRVYGPTQHYITGDLSVQAAIVLQHGDMVVCSFQYFTPAHKAVFL